MEQQQTLNFEARHAAANVCLTNAGDDFKREYLEFALNFGELNERFTNEDIAKAYKQTGFTKPENEDYRATGPIIAGLVRRGVFIQVEVTKSPTRAAYIPVFTKS